MPNIFGPQNMFEVPNFRILGPWKYQKMIFFIKNIKKFACWNIANFVTFLMKKSILLVLLGVKSFKMGYPKNILRPNNILIPSKLDFLGQEPVNQNWGPILVFDEKHHFFVLLRVKNPKIGYHRNILGPKRNLTPFGHEALNWYWGLIFVFSIFWKNLKFHSFLEIPLKCLFEYGPSFYEQKQAKRLKSCKRIGSMVNELDGWQYCLIE